MNQSTPVVESIFASMRSSSWRPLRIGRLLFAPFPAEVGHSVSASITRLSVWWYGGLCGVVEVHLLRQGPVQPLVDLLQLGRALRRLPHGLHDPGPTALIVG